MNTIKQAKHLNDVILGKYGTFRLWRSGISSDGVNTWTAELVVNGKTYFGWASSEEEARVEAAKNYKEGKWEYDNSVKPLLRYDKSKLVTAIQVGDNNWWRVVQKPLIPGTLFEKNESKKQITIHVELPEPIKNMLLMTVIFDFANQKMDDLKLSKEQMDEFVKRLYPIMSYSGLWNDQIPTEELDAFYGIEHQEP
jgi:hypothetical protein